MSSPLQPVTVKARDLRPGDILVDDGAASRVLRGRIFGDRIVNVQSSVATRSHGYSTDHHRGVLARGDRAVRILRGLGA